MRFLSLAIIKLVYLAEELLFKLLSLEQLEVFVKVNREILMAYQLKIKKLRPYLYLKLINMFKNLLNMLPKILIYSSWLPLLDVDVLDMNLKIWLSYSKKLLILIMYIFL